MKNSIADAWSRIVDLCFLLALGILHFAAVGYIWLCFPDEADIGFRKNLGWLARFVLYGIFVNAAVMSAAYTYSILSGNLGWARGWAVLFGLLTVYFFSRTLLNLKELERVNFGEAAAK